MTERFPPERFLLTELIPATDWLTQCMVREMGSHQALVQLLSIGLHEGDMFRARFQYGKGSVLTRPAHSFFGFEGHKGQALDWVMTDPRTAKYARMACHYKSVEFSLEHVYWTIAGSDWLACVMARLLLFLDPHPVPDVDDIQGGYACYLRQWRPGKPPGLEKWTDVHNRATAAWSRVKTTPERFGGPDMSQLTATSLTASELAAVNAARQQKSLLAPPPTEAETKRAMVATRTPDGSYLVDPPQPSRRWFRPTFILAILGFVPVMVDTLAPLIEPANTAVRERNWGAFAAAAASAIMILAQKWNDNATTKAAASVMVAHVDPVGAAGPVAGVYGQAGSAIANSSGMLDVQLEPDTRLDELAAAQAAMSDRLDRVLRNLEAGGQGAAAGGQRVIVQAKPE